MQLELNVGTPVNIAGRHRREHIILLMLMQSVFGERILPSAGELVRETETSMAAPRILLADDQEEMLQTVVLVLGDEFNIVGTAEDGKHAVELATQLAPDVLILDISMPIVNGIEAACRLKGTWVSAQESSF